MSRRASRDRTSRPPPAAVASPPRRGFQPSPLAAGSQGREGGESQEEEVGPAHLQPLGAPPPRLQRPLHGAPRVLGPQVPPPRAPRSHCARPQPSTPRRLQPPVLDLSEPPASSGPRPQAPPPSPLTGGPHSRCRGSRRPARGNRAAAAGLRPGRGRGSRWPAPTRRGSSTPRAEREPAASCAAACGDPEPRRENSGERTSRGTRPAAPARSRASEPAGEPGSELEVSGGRPRLSRAAFSNSARWALRRQRGRGAFSLTLGVPGPRRRQ